MLRGMLEIPFHYLPIHLSLLASCFPDQQALDFLLEEISDIFRTNNQVVCTNTSATVLDNLVVEIDFPSS
jgi:hypothetical protein